MPVSAPVTCSAPVSACLRLGQFLSPLVSESTAAVTPDFTGHHVSYLCLSRQKLLHFSRGGAARCTYLSRAEPRPLTQQARGSAAQDRRLLAYSSHGWPRREAREAQGADFDFDTSSREARGGGERMRHPHSSSWRREARVYSSSRLRQPRLQPGTTDTVRHEKVETRISAAP